MGWGAELCEHRAVVLYSRPCWPLSNSDLISKNPNGFWWRCLAWERLRSPAWEQTGRRTLPLPAAPISQCMGMSAWHGGKEWPPVSECRTCEALMSCRIQPSFISVRLSPRWLFWLSGFQLSWWLHQPPQSGTHATGESHFTTFILLHLIPVVWLAAFSVCSAGVLYHTTTTSDSMGVSC